MRAVLFGDATALLFYNRIGGIAMLKRKDGLYQEQMTIEDGGRKRQKYFPCLLV